MEKNTIEQTFDIKDLELAKSLYGCRSKNRHCSIAYKCANCGKESSIRLRTLIDGHNDSSYKPLCRRCRCLKNGENGHWGKHDLWTPEIREKREKTCLEKYGAKCMTAVKKINELGRAASHSKSAEEKRKSTMLKKSNGPTPILDDDISSKCHWGYEYNSIHFDSSYELAYYIWLTDSKKAFIYHPNVSFEYIDENNKKHDYYPDFLVNGKFYEIKGSQFFNEKNEPYNRYNHSYWWPKYNKMKENGIVILRENDLKEALEYCKSKYGKGYLKSFKLQK